VAASPARSNPAKMRKSREEGTVANPLDQVLSWPATAAVGFASATGLMEKVGPADQPFRLRT